MTQKLTREELAGALDWYISARIRVIRAQNRRCYVFAALYIYKTIWLVVTYERERKPQMLYLSERAAWDMLAEFQEQDNDDAL